MSIILVLLIIIIVILLYACLHQHYGFWRHRGVAQESPLYFLGHMKGFGRSVHWTDINQRIYERFSRTERYCGFFTFLSKAFFVMDLDLIRHIMVSDFASFADRGLFHNVRDDPLTGNLLFLDGVEWRWLRQHLTPVFSSGKMKFMFPTMVEVSQKLVKVCDNNLSEIEAKDLCARFTTDVIGSCAFGLECNSLTDPESLFRRMGRSVTEKPLHSGIVIAFMFAQPNWARALRLRLFRTEVSEFFLKTVSQTLDYRRRENIQRNDLIQLLMELGADEQDKDGLSFVQITAQALMFFLAGFDTSSTTMSFCLYELALNPPVQDKLRQEIYDKLEQSQQLTYEIIQEMPYLDQVVSETLRKYPILPHLLRRSTKEYSVPDSKLKLDPGMRVMIPVHSIHHDPQLYPEPEVFDPSRFEPEEIKKRHPFAYLPFGDGPRSCIGERFGKMQVKIGIVSLVRNFQFLKSQRTQMPLQFNKINFLIAPESGIHLKIEKIVN